jgi:hypothetical protein
MRDVSRRRYDAKSVSSQDCRQKTRAGSPFWWFEVAPDSAKAAGGGDIPGRGAASGLMLARPGSDRSGGRGFTPSGHLYLGGGRSRVRGRGQAHRRESRTARLPPAPMVMCVMGSWTRRPSPVVQTRLGRRLPTSLCTLPHFSQHRNRALQSTGRLARHPEACGTAAVHRLGGSGARLPIDPAHDGEQSLPVVSGGISRLPR